METVYAMWVEVVVPLAAPGYFTYGVPVGWEEAAQPGRGVVVQFGAKKWYTGVVFRAVPAPDYPVKPLTEILDRLVFPQQLDFWNWMSTYYLCSPGEVLRAALPAGLKLESETVIRLSSDGLLPEILDEPRDWLLQALLAQERISLAEIRSLTGWKQPARFIRQWVDEGWIELDERIKTGPATRHHQFVKIISDFDLNNLTVIQRAERQMAIVMKLLGRLAAGKPWVERGALLKETGASGETLKALSKRGWLEYHTGLDPALDMHGRGPLLELTPEQSQALIEVQAQLQSKRVCLLQGVTSSGKTEVYAHLIRQQLNAGKQVLYLLPEIALTTQLIRRLQWYFGDRVLVYHSRLSDGERRRIWQALCGVEAHQPVVVVAARSGLFLPFSNLGLVVVDEEHETSFKQNDPAPRYHGRDVALQLANLFQATVLLGSATPSLETVLQCQQGKFGRVILNRRYLEQPLPAIQVVNLRSFAKEDGMPPVISPPLEEAIRQTLSEGLQVILFQNRRGFAHYLHCLSCQEVPQCVQCDVSLTYHKHDHQLRCHYCGYSIPAPHRCPSCGSEKLTLVGLGTERVEDRLRDVFPHAVIERMDLDTTRQRDAYDQIIQRFSSGQTNILVGTQMLTKGLDFDHVGLVGIMRADVLTNYPDFRASERAWQLMSQVAGRAGRRGQQGKVIIQTTQPKHPVLDHVIHYSWEAFFEAELAERKEFLFPPFVRLIRIEFRSRSHAKALSAAQAVAMALQPGFQGGILGPQAPLVNRIKDHYLQHITIKLPRASKGLEWKHKAVETTLEILSRAPYNTVQVVFDVDPVY